jgi:pimeloyl-ACP methyl ester carboxylesterase
MYKSSDLEGSSMRKLSYAMVVTLAVTMIAFLVGPLLVPISPLEDTVSPEQLTDSDSRFAEINDLQVHYKTAGSGEPVLLLLHGFGASVFSWREVMEPLGELGTVVAFDRPAFGLTERPLSWEMGANPYTPEAQVALVVGLMDVLGVDRAVLVGNSAGGTMAVNAALAHPGRFDALVLVDAAVYQGGGAPSWIRPLLRIPQVDRLGPLFARQIEARGDAFLEGAWHDPSKITSEDRAGYRRPLQVENWDRALWEFTKASTAPEVDRIGSITLPTLVISGDDDRVVPVELSTRLAEALPNAELVVIPNCGHVPQEECPEPFLDAVEAFLGDLP